MRHLAHYGVMVGTSLDEGLIFLGFRHQIGAVVATPRPLCGESPYTDPLWMARNMAPRSGASRWVDWGLAGWDTPIICAYKRRAPLP